MRGLLRPRRRLIERERGASAILITLSAVVLMGMAAVAIDGGRAFDERRQQQSGADVAALAGAQFADRNLPTANATCATLTGTAYAACRGAEEAMKVVDGTLPGTYTAADWLACTDPGKPAKFTRGSTISPCINFTSNFQETRVVLPGIQLDTTFGAMVGLNQVPIGAWAEVGLDQDQSADVLPWAVGPSGSGSNYSCLFANSTSNLNVDPCNGPASGNFGKLDVSLYENWTMGTPQMCGSTNANAKMGVNLITGADHFLEIESKNPATIVHDFPNCPNMGTSVDQVRTQTGNSQNGIMDGLFAGTTETTTDYEGRLLCKNEGWSPVGYTEYGNKDSWGTCVQIGNQFGPIDDNPLWDFITSGPAKNQTVPNGACNGVNTWQEMKDCLAGWKAYVPVFGNHVDTFGNPVGLFTQDLEAAVRFAAVPILNNDPSGGSGDYLITSFKPVYLDTVYLKCNANTCDIAHSPGIGEQATTCPNPLTSATRSCGFGSNGNKAIVAITSYMLTIDMLDPETQENFPNKLGTKVYNLKR